MDVKEIARSLLAKCDCTESSYEGEPVELILRDLNEAYPDGYCGCSNEELAAAIYAISTTDRGWKPPIYFEVDGSYATKWGATDFYDDDLKQSLGELIASGEPFKTDSIDSRKEIFGWSLSRKYVGGPMTIHTWAAMDEEGDLVYDALPDGVDLDEEEVEEILDLYDGVFETGQEQEIDGSATLDDVLKKVDELIDDDEQYLQENFEQMKAIVTEYLAFRDRNK